MHHIHAGMQVHAEFEKKSAVH